MINVQVSFEIFSLGTGDGRCQIAEVLRRRGVKIKIIVLEEVYPSYHDAVQAMMEKRRERNRKRSEG